MSEKINHRILVIDDNQAIHDDFKKILCPEKKSNASLDAMESALFGDDVKAEQPKEMAQFEISSALHGEDGLKLVEKSIAENKPYAMAFIDVRMPPGWDGIETTSRIWQVDPDLQVVICTAYSDYSWDEMISRLGQSDRLVILKKPFDNIEVIQFAYALTEKWSLLQQAQLRLYDLEQMVMERTQQLAKNEERFRLITENAADLIAILTNEGKFHYISPSYLSTLGYDSNALQDTPLMSLVHPEDASSVETALRTKTGKVLEYRIKNKMGELIPVESHISPVHDANENVEHIVLVSRDISERKKAEKEHQQMEIQLRHAQKMESIGQLASGVAHEINTPMQYINDNVHFLQTSFAKWSTLSQKYLDVYLAAKNGGVTPAVLSEADAAAQKINLPFLMKEVPEAINQTIQGIDHVSNIVRAMKEFSHPGKTEKIPINLNHSIENTVVIATNAWKYIADIKTNLDPNLPLVVGMHDEINQVILNLIVNATQAIEDVVGNSGNKGLITISTSHTDKNVTIKIGDTGTGIPEKIKNRIFDPFFTTKPVGKGTGQGLAIAHSVIVEKHHGTIDFETEVGKGTTFIISLPLDLPPKAD